MRCIARSTAPRALVAAIAAGALASCGGGGAARSVFHASDPEFRPAPGQLPPVYLPADLETVPRAPMRSVGVIEVTVPERGGTEAAARAAADKGRELGCWIVVEHEAFGRAQARASLAFGARVLLAHGAGAHVSPGSPHRAARRKMVQFDCVLQVTSTLTWRPRAEHPAQRRL